MPNNLVFNDAAQNLKTEIYGLTGSSVPTAVLVGNDGTLQIGGTISATIANTVTVTGQVSVTANDFDIRALSAATDTVSISGTISAVIDSTVTVTGEITATIANTVTVTGQVSVTANNFDIRALTAATDTISIGGNGFTSSTLLLTTSDGALTNTAFNFDTSQYKTYSFYVVNTGTAAVSVQLQVSPTSTETYYTDDKTVEVTATQDEKVVLIPGYYFQYTRIQLTASQTATAIAYFNAQY